jgi:hypothetical protein
MATTEIREQRGTIKVSAVMRAVQTPAVACGECIYHIPHATKPDGWCACKGSKQRWQPVEASRRVCQDFAVWPEGSPVPAYLAAMRF